VKKINPALGEGCALPPKIFFDTSFCFSYLFFTKKKQKDLSGEKLLSAL